MRLQFGPEFRGFVDGLVAATPVATQVDIQAEWKALLKAERPATGSKPA
jgi:hypothetical protein